MLLFSMTIQLKDFDFDNISIDVKSHKNILIYDISFKTLINSKPLSIRLAKKMDLLEFMV